MTSELYFIYDSHCPWSYAGCTLINALVEAFPEMPVHAWHCVHYDGSDGIERQQIDAVTKHSTVKFGQGYLRDAATSKDSVMTANLMAWLQNKHPEKLLPLLNALQKSHFNEGTAFARKQDFSALIEQFKLSPPNKIFRSDLTDEAEYTLADIAELQDFIGTNAFPALLLTQGDNALLLDHSLYLKKPQTVVKAVMQALQ